MSVALLVVDDGRADYLDRCLESIAAHLPPMDYCVMVDDSDHELGFGGAIQTGWDAVLETDATHVWHAESDFVYTQSVPIHWMQKILEGRPHLAQVALKRQVWNDSEKAAGGIVEQDPDSYTEFESIAGKWTEHSICFTTNPSLYPRHIVERGWPQVAESEGVFSGQLRDDGLSFAYLGGKFDPPRCEHIGLERVGVGY